MYASVTANNGQTNNGAAVCHSNASKPGSCTVTGSVQVSGTYATCPGAGTSQSDACKRLEFYISPDNFTAVDVTVTGPDNKDLKYKYSNVYNGLWDFNKSKIIYVTGDYNSFNTFSFFGPE